RRGLGQVAIITTSCGIAEFRAKSGQKVPKPRKMRKSDRMRLAKKWQHSLGRATLYLGLAGALAVTGCGDGKVGPAPVHGSVNIDGKPAGGVVLFFCPTDGSPEVQKLRPMGVTEADGKFELTTVDKGDGAPPAHYKVIMMWPGKGAAGRDGTVDMGPDRLQN